ncbi:ralA-binding protein 1 [Nilaparvata lugens]|uniref:ralA-binding protein 1 n=1 Tax=Nilaparvata lugens TaxID=108931 RepID=UPI00193CF803|nr:ralA-binding protein 1 [Nilaparvata lugens]
MEFESPDVEKDFPGLYASESGKKSNESDFSDEAHERVSKKDLLIGKRKDKKDSKKDRGYATLEGESSPEEDTADIRSPSKAKKSKPFKFPSKKEKREKSREKDSKEKDSDKDKDKKKDSDKEKDKKKELKSKLKLKERKKLKHGEESLDIAEEQPIFGVALSLALERNRCHDGVEIPVVIRDCINHIQETGLCVEGLYKVSGIKSKVHHVRRLYNQREAVCLSDYDIPVCTSLLKLFMRDLPEPIVTTKLVARFEEAAALKDLTAREAELSALVLNLPACNRELLGWMVKHLAEVAVHEKQNKMNVQNLSITLSPSLQMSQKAISALIQHCDSIFPDIKLTKYIGPLTSGSPGLPESAEAIAEELKKQESLLGQVHSEMNAGFVTKQREELLWEVQRMITQLKRKLRILEKGSHESSQAQSQSRVCDETDAVLPTEELPSPAATVGEPAANPLPTPPSATTTPTKHVVEAIIESTDAAQSHDGNTVVLNKDSSTDQTSSSSVDELALCLETEELLILVNQLQSQIANERAKVANLRSEVLAYGGNPAYCHFLMENCSKDAAAICTENPAPEDGAILKQVLAETQVLQLQKKNLTQTIIEEQANCINLKIQMKLLQISSS